MTFARRLPQADAYTVGVTSKVRTNGEDRNTREFHICIYLICGAGHKHACLEVKFGFKFCVRIYTNLALELY